MRLRLDASSYFTIPYTVFEVLLQMRGAIDPDSGQIVCHFLDIGVAALETGDGPVPAIVLDGCVIATFGRENVERVLSSAEPRPVESIQVKRGALVFGDVEVDNYWGPVAVAFAAETGSPVKAYELIMDLDGRGAPIAALLVEETDAGPMLMLIPRSCEYIEEEEGSPPTHM